MKQKKKSLNCKQCGHKWERRKETLPLRCPNQLCQSPYWDGKGEEKGREVKGRAA